MINVEEKYQFYLEKVGLNESTMHPIQIQQLRETFFGAFGIMIRILSEEDINEKDLNSIGNQVASFFKKTIIINDLMKKDRQN